MIIQQRWISEGPGSLYISYMVFKESWRAEKKFNVEEGKGVFVKVSVGMVS